MTDPQGLLEDLLADPKSQMVTQHWGNIGDYKKIIFHLTDKMKKLIGLIYEKATQNDPSWNRPHETYHCFYRETYIKGNDEKIVEGKEC